MSFQKFYGRQFVKLAEDNYIPLVLWGASNCYEFVGGREVLERYWSTFGPDEITTVEKFTKWISGYVKTNPDIEVWKNGSRWVTWKQMLRWADNAFSKALTIEEIYSITGRRLTIILNDKQHKLIKRVDAKTTAEILEFFEFYVNMPDIERRKTYLYYDFGTREPLKIPKVDTSGKVVVKDQKNKSYLCSYLAGKELNFSRDPNKALVFENAEEALAQLGRGWKIKIVSAKSLEEAKKPKYFAIYTGYHGFVKERSKSRLYFTRDVEYAKLFKTEKQAQKYADELNKSFVISFGVVDVRKLEEEE